MRLIWFTSLWMLRFHRKMVFKNPEALSFMYVLFYGYWPHLSSLCTICNWMASLFNSQFKCWTAPEKLCYKLCYLKSCSDKGQKPEVWLQQNATGCFSFFHWTDFSKESFQFFVYFCICILLYLYWCTFIGISMKFDYNKMQRGAFPLNCFFQKNLSTGGCI